LSNEDEIYVFIQQQKQNSLLAQQQMNTQEEKIVHKVKYGETLKSIAAKYGISVQDIKTWNYIGRRGLKPGKHLIIYKPTSNPSSGTKTLASIDTKSSTITTNSVTPDSTNSIKEKDNIYHIVRKSETIYSIARKYNISVNDLLNQNGLTIKHNLKVGEKLLIKKKKE